DQGATPAAKDEQMSTMRVALELLLHQQRQTIKALAHVGVPHRKPYPHSARHRDHRRRAIFTSASISTAVIDGSAGPLIVTRARPAGSISIVPDAAGKARSAGASDTAANSGTSRRRAGPAPARRAWRLHTCSKLG